MSDRRSKTVLTGLVWLVWLITPLLAWSEEEAAVTAERPAEYMIYQYPDTILVLKIDVREAEFSVRTSGPDNAMLKASSVAGRRIGPVYQYIDAAEQPRQLMIRISPGREMARSAISLEIQQFSAGDRNSAPLARAYQMLSLGTETTHGTDASTWASKAYSLRNAAGIFANLGREEMRLWSDYFAAHLVLHQLQDPLMALELADGVLQGASLAGFEQVELAARTLEADAVLQLAAGSGDQSAGVYYGRAHEVLQEVTSLAQRLELNDELGRALFLDGRAYEAQEEPERALERYQAALEVVAGTNDVELLNQIRATAATVYESLGSTTGAIALLGVVADDLAAVQHEDADLELASRLFEKGRLLNSTYRYTEAVAELARALELQRAKMTTPVWGPTGLELAWAHYSMGNAEEALRLLDVALTATPGPGGKDLLARAYGSLGNIHRQRREFEQAARAREKQGEMTGEGAGYAAYLLEAALDASAQGSVGVARAQELLQRARRAAAAEGDELNVQRANLYLCLAQADRGVENDCGAVTAYDRLRLAGIPRMAADASLTRARVLRRSGSAKAARDSLEQLIEELYWYRRALPGVLGAWYAEHRAELVQEYLSLVRATTTGETGGANDGEALLLAMERVRVLESADYPQVGDRVLDVEHEELLRSLLARRESASGDDAPALAEEVNRHLSAARGATGSGMGAISASVLEGHLRGLGRSEALLSYYFDGGRTQALVALRGGVQAIELPGGNQIEERLDQLRDTWNGPVTPALPDQLEVLGQLMLKPLAAVLPEKVYLLPVGPLRGLPLDALRLNGRYFAEQHVLVNLANLGSIARRTPAVGDDFRERVFLAGNPQSKVDPFSLEFRDSPEVAAVTDQFVGPGLHIVQGVALQKDEFHDERFAQAALVHLALAGTLDLAFPDRSRLLLAPVSVNPAGNDPFLAPRDVRGFRMSAQLVVLSGTAVLGNGRSLVDSRMPFVADFLEAGCGAVLVAYRAGGESENADFATTLYSRLQSDPDIATALTKTKRTRIKADGQTNLPYWAGFQLFIR